MKVLMLKPPGLEKGGTRTPDRICEHLGIGYICAVLRKNGIKAEILDSSLAGLRDENLCEYISGMEFDILAITIPYQESIAEVLEMVKILRRRGIGKHILAGGHPPTFYYRELLENENGIDSVCLGEGEYTVLELARRLENGIALEGIKGLAFRADGKIVFNGYRELIPDLDELPFPERDNLDAMLKAAPGLSIDISGSRGCSWASCSFCDVQSFYRLCDGRKWRGRSPKNIADELEMLLGKYKRNRFSFIDDDFFGPKGMSAERIEGFCNEIKKKDMKIKFSILCNVRDIEEKTLQKLKDAGLDRIFLGIESGVQRVLDTLNKGVTVEENRNAVRKVKQLGIWCRCGSIFTDPYTTIGEVRENIEFWESIDSMSMEQYKELSVFKGTPLQYGLLDQGVVREEGFLFRYDHFLDPQVAKLNQIAEEIRSGYIMPAFDRIRRLETGLMRTIKGNSRITDDAEGLLESLARLKYGLFHHIYADMLKKIISDMDNINEINIEFKLGRLFKPHYEQLGAEFMKLKSGFEEILSGYKPEGRRSTGTTHL